ncbi:MBL fold metallo-hydrolase [Saccharopolyspora subtropica]|uniref:MBL fold metallo-hydrolase n=1 Tax=Saccharopolyspora thermophila TaxID=89367 RepID=A0A917NCG6_9PSEU|nr:MBL fold metallo-hydrolase [Saccharopolyspora subtropica]GGI88265.1 MBL fold metallo-hydrolase [Saccharopolyspora subtropica]
MGDSRHEWMRPGAYEVAPGVHRIPLPLPNDGLRAVNVYAIADGDALTLVDGGWALAESRDQLTSALRQIGAGLGDIRRFLVTHAHRDHYTQAIALRRELGAKVLLGEEERHTIRALMDPGHRSLGPQLEMLAECGAKPVRDAVLAARDDGPPHFWEEPDEWIGRTTDVGLADRPLRAMATPGHTRGHLVFLDDAHGLMFAGDHVLPHITPSIGFEQVPSAAPLRDYLESLRLVRTLPDMRLLPAHGPVTDSVHQRVDELLDHHDTRLHATAAVIAAGASTAYEAARALTWTRRERTLDELDPFNQMLAVLETAAHLDVLELQGRLRKERVEGVVHYSAP